MMADQPRGNLLTPTFHGYIASTMDALILFEACLSGRLYHVPRRPHDRERGELIASGNVFVYEEHSSGIKRWTDGVAWSPSRILGNFLLYRELDKPFNPGEKKRAMKRKPEGGVAKPTNASRSNSVSFNGGQPVLATNGSMMSGYDHNSSPGSRPDTERALVGSLVDSYQFKQGGLVKKTISVLHRGVQHHMVSYYRCEDVSSGRLKSVQATEGFQDLRPRPSLISSSNFRAPVDDSDPTGMNGFQQLWPNSHPVASSYANARSMSVPHLSIQYPSSAWGSQPPYIPHQAYTIPQTLPPPVSFSYDRQSNQHSMAPYRAPQYPASAYAMELPIRRHSTMHPVDTSGQMYPSLSSTDRDHMGSTPLLGNGSGLGSHGLVDNASYTPGAMFEASAVAATSGNSSSAYEANSSNRTNGTYDHPSSSHQAGSFDAQVGSGYDPSASRHLSDFDQNTASFGSTSNDTTPGGLHLGMEHSESMPPNGVVEAPEWSNGYANSDPTIG